MFQTELIRTSRNFFDPFTASRNNYDLGCIFIPLYILIRDILSRLVFSGRDLVSPCHYT